MTTIVNGTPVYNVEGREILTVTAAGIDASGATLVPHNVQETIVIIEGTTSYSGVILPTGVLPGDVIELHSGIEDGGRPYNVYAGSGDSLDSSSGQVSYGNSLRLRKINATEWRGAPRSN